MIDALFDKELAFQAQSSGAEINTKSSITSVNFVDNLFSIKLSSGKIFKSKFLWKHVVLAMLLKKDYEKLFPLGQFEVYAHSWDTKRPSK